MINEPIYHHEYQCDIPGSFIFKSTRDRLTEEQNRKLDEYIQVWTINTNNKHLPPAMQQLIIDQKICIYIFSTLKR